MAKHKSATTIRLSEIGKCIRRLHSKRLELLQLEANSDLRYGLAYAITVLGEYKWSVKVASEGQK